MISGSRVTASKHARVTDSPAECAYCFRYLQTLRVKSLNNFESNAVSLETLVAPSVIVITYGDFTHTFKFLWSIK